MIRVLVADDSRAARLLIASLLAADPEVTVVGEAVDGHSAVELARSLRPDVITMDIHMPGLDGLDATARIMNEVPTPIVVVSSSVSAADVATSMEAMRAGAVMALPKPGGAGAGTGTEEERDFVNSVKAMAQVKVVRRWSGSYRAVEERETPVPPRRAALRDPLATPISLVAIAASTGGPTALQRILAALPATFPVPILVVQHIARGFLPGFASWLNAECSLRVEVAAAGTVVQPGAIYVAPDDVHLAISPLRRIQLLSAPPVNGFRPSASVLFEAAADAVGAALAAVILTGMGSDGVSGLRRVRARDGYIIAQDEGTSLIYGMPGEAVAAGVTDAVLPVGEIAGQLSRLVGGQG